ncbi:MAG: rhomboid family intramembrane serine protease [Desulfobulbaceae bacterium]|nr:rhomboid family intramembrane serine protease [Desulfobulbaceae bacterium]
MERFIVKFRRNFFTGQATNSFNLSGTGELDLGSSVVIRAKRNKPLGSPASVELSFDPAQIVNVQREGRSVRFEMLAGTSAPKAGHMTILLENEASAQRLAKLLPTTQSAILKQDQHDIDDFTERLMQATPHAFVTPTIVAVNVIIFAAMVISGVDLLRPDGRMLISWGSNFGPYTSGGQWWRLLSSMFLHVGLIHLTLNMWVLYYTGKLVERLYGSAHYALLYVLAGLAGSIASLHWNPMINSAGASGAIFGVYGALLAFMLDRRNQVPVAIMKSQSTIVIGFIFYSLIYGMRQEGIDNAAHLGGLAGGFVMGWLLARPLSADLRAQTGLLRPLLSLLAATLALILLTLPIKNTGEAYRKEEQYHADMSWFAEQEKMLSAELENWQQLAASGSSSPEGLLKALERDIVAPWEAIYERLSATPLDENSRLRAHQVLVLESVTNRRDAFRLTANSIRDGDQEKMEQAKRHFDASNEAIKKLQQLLPQQ